MSPVVSLSIQRRITALDLLCVLSILLALLSLPSILLTAGCLSVCLFVQGLAFRAFFKYVKDGVKMAKRLFFMVANFIVVIILLLNS
jgi:hypothetical protein